MVEKAPDFIDVTEVQFKLQNKIRIFNGESTAKPNCQLIATASAFGLIFVASPLPELKVVQLSTIAGEKIPGENAPTRTIQLPSEATQIAINCDNTLLAVDVVINGITMIILYAVQSFLSHQVKVLQSIRLSPDNGIRSKQLAWNPTIPGVLAVCLENGALSMFVLKDQGFEFHTVDKSQAISSVCWSPKGKQIVAGCPNGKLIQYKPDLKPIRVIDCPLEPQGTPVVAISIQWLSTYQFAVVFAPIGEPKPPNLYVVNAPKNGQISCINYEDICYSGSGPRQTQAYLIHILPWNTLLMASANSMEVGVLATNEAGDAPLWRQWSMLDEARAELPLTAMKQESYPIGFALETGCTHRLIIGEVEMPVMPMIHLLSTDGVLVSFNILNTIPNIPGICSPPRPLADTSGLAEFAMAAPIQKPQPIQAQPPALTASPPGLAKDSEITFSPSIAATSTPMAQPKAKGMFGGNEAFKPPPSAFGSWNQQPPPAAASKAIPPLVQNENIPKTVGTTIFGGSLGGGSMNVSPFGSVAKPAAAVPLAKPIVTKPQAPPVASEPGKPFITVPPNYTASQATERKPPAKAAVIPLDDENNAVIQKMIMEEVQTFEKDLKDFMRRSQNIDTQIGNQETLAGMTKHLREMTDLTVQATESNDSLSTDVRSLTMSLNEAFMMSAEAKSKWEVVQNPTYTNINLRGGANQTNRRQLSKLQAMLANNRVHLEEINKQIDSIWVLHEEEKKQYRKDRMRVPKIEVIYQTINVQREILMRQQERLNEIKAKLDVKLNRKTPLSVQDVDSLSDSIVSLALVEQIEAETRKLDASKLKKLQEHLKNHTVRTIHPKRPERKGIKSEIVYEKREAEARAKTLQGSQKVQQPSPGQPAFAFGGTLNAAQSMRVVTEPKAPPATRPVAKAKQVVTKPITVTDSKPIPMISKASVGAFEPSKTFTSTAPVAFEPKTETKSFVFGAPKCDVEENRVPQQDVVFGLKPSIPTVAKPSIASPTVAALLTKTSVSNENTTSSDGKAAEQNKTTAFAFNIQKSPLGVFNQGNKGGLNMFAPASSSVTTSPISASSSVFSQLSQAPSTTTSSSIFSSLSFASLSQSGTIPKNDKLSTPVAPTAVSGSKGLGVIVTSTAAVDLSTPVNTTGTAAVAKQTEEAKKEIPGFKLSFPPLAPMTKESSAPVSSFAPSDITITTIAKTIPTTATTSVSSFDADNLLKNLSFCKPNVADKAPDAKTSFVFSIGGLGASSDTASTTTTASIFGSTAGISAASIFGSATTTTSIFGTSTTTTTTASVFGSPSSTTKSLSVFASPTATTTAASIFSPVATSAVSSVFGSAATTTAPTAGFATAIATTASDFGHTTSTTTTASEPFKISFGSMTISSSAPATTVTQTITSTSPPSGFFSKGIIKTEAQPFAADSTQTTTTVASPFASLTTSVSPGSPFGASATSTAASSPFGASGGNIFGASGGFQTQTSESTASVFGSPASKSSSIFGGATTFGQQTPPSSGSIFGGGITPSSGSGSIFGGASPAPATTTASVFGGSVFGGGGAQSSPAQGQASVFGGGMDSNSSTTFGGFGQQQQEQQGYGAASTFGRASFGANAGAFAQGGPSVAQSGFGSPTNVFAKPTPGFGTSPTFGGPPTFGSPPTFGGAATFGSPIKSSGFGSFSNTPANSFQNAPGQQNNLFAALGSSDSGMTFGNLAQNNNANQAKMQFGGSAFSTWRQ